MAHLQQISERQLESFHSALYPYCKKELSELRIDGDSREFAADSSFVPLSLESSCTAVSVDTCCLLA